MLPRGYQILRAELPDVVAPAAGSGGLTYNLVADALAAIPGATPARTTTASTPRPAGARSIEWAFATARPMNPASPCGAAWRSAASSPGPSPRAGRPARHRRPCSPTARRSPPTSCIDATGRRSPTVDWLADLGGPAPRGGVRGHRVHVHGALLALAGRRRCPRPGPRASRPCGSISLLDHPVRQRHVVDDHLHRVGATRRCATCATRRCSSGCGGSFPDHAHWLDGEPISEHRHDERGRRPHAADFVVDGVPVVTGMLTIADAARLHEPVGRPRHDARAAAHGGDARRGPRSTSMTRSALALAFDAATVEQLDPWHAGDQGSRPRPDRRDAGGDRRRRRWSRRPRRRSARRARRRQPPSTRMPCAGSREMLSCLTLPMDAVRPARRVRAGARAGAGRSHRPAPYGPDRTQLLELVTSMVVLVHGNPETAAIWDPLIAELGRDDVVALSPPGFGAPVPDGFGGDERRVPRLAGRRARAASTARSTSSATTGAAATCSASPRRGPTSSGRGSPTSPAAPTPSTSGTTWPRSGRRRAPARRRGGDGRDAARRPRRGVRRRRHEPRTRRGRAPARPPTRWAAASSPSTARRRSRKMTEWGAELAAAERRPGLVDHRHRGPLHRRRGARPPLGRALRRPGRRAAGPRPLVDAAGSGSRRQGPGRLLRHPLTGDARARRRLCHRTGPRGPREVTQTTTTSLRHGKVSTEFPLPSKNSIVPSRPDRRIVTWPSSFRRSIVPSSWSAPTVT